jgi:mannose-6-phosphate isomerase-like protein (cupin superfamily)
MQAPKGYAYRTLHVLDPGGRLEVDPGVAHQALNRGTEDVMFLVISQPPSHSDREVVPPTP